MLIELINVPRAKIDQNRVRRVAKECLSGDIFGNRVQESLLATLSPFLPKSPTENPGNEIGLAFEFDFAWTKSSVIVPSKLARREPAESGERSKKSKRQEYSWSQ
eukprot:scaffold5120_cov63-Skeletonema_dohrnii-CCMP3373.AAC.1